MIQTANVHTIATLDQLDEKLAQCERAAEISDDDLRRVFQTFRMDISAQLPPDPFSAEYLTAQMALYERIAGRQYSTSNERSILDLDSAIARPFPYTASPQVAGTHLAAIDFLLRNMYLPPGARVLDAGPGWGNTTLALAQLGFEVTALDIEPRFCELIRERARRAGVQVEVVNEDFFWIEKVAGSFEAIVFFESFHHCADHARLLRSLGPALSEGGHVYFGGEPITPDFPVPWGLRSDGESLWAVRRHGWLELGFHPDYFRRALRQAGFFADVHTSADLPWINVWDAKLGASDALQTAGPPNPRKDADDNAFIVDIYRGLLRRDPDAVGMRDFSNMLRAGSLDRVGLISAILSSKEFKSGFAGGPTRRWLPPGCRRSQAKAVFRRFQKYQGPGRPGFVTHFLGLISAIFSSKEFKSGSAGEPQLEPRLPPGCRTSEAETVFKRFQKYQGPGRPGFVTNFLGG
jgi:SAM-dependent methyltransferase